MDYLIRCTCDHAIDLHDGDGCSGGRLRRCPCTLDRAGALNTAVSAVRAEPANYAPAPSSRD